MANDPKLGVSGTMSMEPPSPKDIKLDDALLQELKSRNEFEAPEETQRRHSVLDRLESVLKRLVAMVGKQQGLPPGILNEAGGKIFTFGSFELGVYGPKSDMDTLMAAPKHVSREDFFQYMPDLLRKEFKPEEIAELTPVPGISVPIIKLELCGVSVDLIFCRLHLQSVPKSQELSNLDLLRGLDDTDLKCVNGTRVTRRILELVPQTKVFRMALRAVKLWAKQRALYGNIVGYPGGVAYAMMVARICQLYPRAAAPLVIWKFFYLMRKWNWPSPVLLQNHEEGSINLREWDPSIYPGDKRHLMPIITPAFPRANACHTIGPSTKKVLLQEMERAEGIVRSIYESGRPWRDLFQRHSFFTDAYRHYICVITAGRTKEAQQAWSGLVESKVKWLIVGIEHSDAKSVELVQPYNKGFNRVHECKGDADIDKTLDGNLDCQVKEIKTVTTEQAGDVQFQAAAQTDTDGQEVPAPNGEAEVPPQTDGPQTIWTTTFYLGIGLTKGANSLDISSPIRDFTQQCKEWQNYDENLHSIRVKHMRNYDLPADVFAEGETRPTRTKKKSAPKTTDPTAMDAANKKRSFNNSGLDTLDDPAKRRASANGTATPNGVPPR
ncbi:Poly(A) polymerase papa [Neohortaea acidophila]|uniref:Poly(A) polymerase n=1 Tax=Neohortaea acidophila TaxID=245834 RepID=A0A6A6PLQ0_9PEZI|nr:Poly(A) polymerase papa [Neohortaea acidophila]KAF2480912.1 Poly(A) polymerase papa [Neohortaea acidophila]